MKPSPSGARLQGDDYQHLVVWYEALRLLLPDHGVTMIEVEAVDAGNVDDVVTRRPEAGDEYRQVKYSVDATHPITSEWLTSPTATKGKSPLQRFSDSWKKIKPKKKKGSAPLMTLFTNRVLDVSDPILKLREGQRNTLAARLAEEKPTSPAGLLRATWAKHASLTESELLELLEELAFRTDEAAFVALMEAASDRMRAVGLRADEEAVLAGISAVRGWVKDGVREVDREQLTAVIEQKALRAGKQYVPLLIEAIDRAKWPDAAQVRLDWVDLFAGTEPRARVQLHDPALWNTRIRKELVDAAARLHAARVERVLVRGYMRLPLWFLVGVELPETRGHHVACTQRGQWWSSEVAATPFQLQAKTKKLEQGDALAVALSLTNPIGDDVVAYCRSAGVPVASVLEISPKSGAGADAIHDDGEARGWALAVRAKVRDALRKMNASRVHLFLSGPAGSALFLGHVWNRVAPTTVYEHRPPGYVPTFEVP